MAFAVATCLMTLKFISLIFDPHQHGKALKATLEGWRTWRRAWNGGGQYKQLESGQIFLPLSPISLRRTLALRLLASFEFVPLQTFVDAWYAFGGCLSCRKTRERPRGPLQSPAPLPRTSSTRSYRSPSAQGAHTALNTKEFCALLEATMLQSKLPWPPSVKFPCAQAMDPEFCQQQPRNQGGRRHRSLSLQGHALSVSREDQIREWKRLAAEFRPGLPPITEGAQADASGPAAGQGPSGAGEDEALWEALLRAPATSVMSHDGEALFTVEPLLHTVTRTALGTGETRTVAGQCGLKGFRDGAVKHSRLNYPYGVALDLAGARLFIAQRGHDDSEQLIRRRPLSRIRCTHASCGAGP